MGRSCRCEGRNGENKAGNRNPRVEGGECSGIMGISHAQWVSWSQATIAEYMKVERAEGLTRERESKKKRKKEGRKAMVTEANLDAVVIFGRK